MQSVILTAGMGKRIQDVSEEKPKCLLEIKGKSILEWQLDNICFYTDTPPIVVVGYQEEKIRSRLSGRDIVFVHNPEYATTNILASLWYALHSCVITDSLVCMPGDLIFERRVLGALLDAPHPVTIAVQRRPCDDEAVKVVIEGSCVRAIGKKINTGEADYEFLGIFKAEASSVEMIRQRVDAMMASGMKDGYMFSILHDMIRSGFEHIGFVDIGSFLWEEIDYPQDYKKALEKF